MIEMRVSIKGMTVEKLDRYSKFVAPKIVRDSQMGAINKTIPTIRSQTVKEISKASGVSPQKTIKGRTPLFKANRKRLAGGVIFRYAPMPAEVAAGKAGPKQLKKGGVKAGKFRFQNAFTGTPHKGKHANKRKRVYERVARTNNPRTDLRAQYIQLDKHINILHIVGKRVTNEKLETEFIKQWNWRMEKAGYR